MIPYHSIKNNQQLTHAGGNDYLVSFTFLFKANGKCAYDWIETTGGKCSHVEYTANIFSAAPDMRLAVIFSRRAIPGGQACKGGDFLPIETAEFGQIGDEHCAGLRANAWSALEDAVFVFEVVIGIDMFSDEMVNFVDLEVECFDHFLNALFNLRVVNHKQTIRFLSSQVVELPTSSDQLGQFSGLGRRMRFRCRLDDLSEFGQNLRIDGVGLCPLPHAVGEVTYLPRIDNNNRQVCIEQFGDNGSFVASGRFKDNKSDVMIFEALTKLAMTIRCVWQTSFQDRGAGCNVEGVFCDIDTDINFFRHGFLPYLQMRARSFPAAQTAVRAGPIAAARFPLRDGLDGPNTTELSSPAGACSARYARLASTSFIRQTYGGFTYETIINHG